MRYFRAVSVVLLSVAPISVFALNNDEECNGGVKEGETFCEKSGFTKTECQGKACCAWNKGKCWYDEGNPGGVILPGVVGWANGAVVWSDPPSEWGQSDCKKVTTVFGAAVCVTKNAWKKKDECDHIANVYYQLLDNDADGVADDPKVLSELVNGGYLLIVPGKESEETNKLPVHGEGQPLGTNEAVINSCNTPTNRGASATDRSTWTATVDTSNKGCSNERDASHEEILHLITNAALKIYPDLWKDTFSSEVGAALLAANGNCGWGYTKDWKDPSTNKCEGQYAYDDKTCKEACLVVEGIYWASTSYVGGLYTKEQTDNISSEWLMGTPDEDMTVFPKSVSNAVSLEKGSPVLYNLVSDTTSVGHAWLPAIMTDGKYTGVPGGPDGEKCTDKEASVKYKYKKKGKKITGTCGLLEKEKETQRKKTCKKQKNKASSPNKKCPCVCE